LTPLIGLHYDAPVGMYFLILLTCVFLVSPVARAQQAIFYTLDYSHPGEKRLSVRIGLPDATPGVQTLVIPRAVPMGYGDEPYDRFTENVRANSPEGELLPLEREEGPRWRLGRAERRVGSVTYEVNLERMEREILSGGDSSRTRENYVSLLGYSVFGYIEGSESRPVQLTIKAPSDWPVLSTLAPQVPPPTGTLQTEAANYYALADSQVVLGRRAHIEKIDVQPPVYLVLYSESPADPAVVSAEAAEAFRRILEYFGSAPMTHYSVLVEWLAPLSPEHQYHFSLEHLDSGTFCLAASQALTAKSSTGDRLRARFNFAHHMAHAWIPKRAYGEGYFPFLWETSPVIDSIWFSEGFPQYAAMEAVAAGLPDSEATAFRQRVMDGRFRAQLSEMPAWLRNMPLVELSRIASTRYTSDFRTGQTVFARGALLAAEIDERIRQRTGGAKSLRDALRFLVAWSAREHRAFRTGELADLFRQSTGVDTNDIIERELRPLDK
jgi:predicted metalloprotease with PDZ domain